ncbi:FAD-dependent oxidoreductase [Catenulispora rubra]|uniref:FAD-dependent oxidoreductase n=1 Tax=Catenulispora rubra TaxID=280293 RepID=UPI001892074F|nr:FAD-dependent oxidoreductase [Catenulispora rubra]
MAGPPRIAVVGGSLAGLRATEQLRSAGHSGPITVFGAEAHLPYNRPPLAKEALASSDHQSITELAERLLLRRRASTGDVTFRLGDPVISADLASGTLITEDDHYASYDGLVIATGLRPRRLNVPGPALGRHVLRTVEDCHRIRTAIAPPRNLHVVVVGAGFVGCEVASTLSSLGHTVTIVEPAGPPMVRVLGQIVADAVQRHHEGHGVRFVTGGEVAGFTGDARIDGVALSTGEVLPADLVVEAIGSACNVEWLQGNSLDLRDGVLAGNDLLVAGTSRTVAVGDVVRFPNPLFDDIPRRVEHWSIPGDTAKRAAGTLLSLLRDEPPDVVPFAPIPSFWSDQFGLRFQSYGSPGLGDEVVVTEGDTAHLGSGLLATYHRSGQHVGTLALNLSPARQRELRSAFVQIGSTA